MFRFIDLYLQAEVIMEMGGDARGVDVRSVR
jgi:hypothetical protein